MKKQFLILLGLGAVMLTSCSKEETLKGRLNDSDWKATKATMSVNGNETDYTSSNIVYHFSSDGTGKFTSNTTTYTYKWTTDGEHVTLTEMSNNINGKAEYEVKENKKKTQKWEANQTSGSNTIKTVVELEKQ